MTNIEMTYEMSEAIRLRLTREYSEVCATNFAQDILIEAMKAEIVKQREHIEALQERVSKLDETVHQQLLDLGSKAAAAKQKMIDAKKAGTDTGVDTVPDVDSLPAELEQSVVHLEDTTTLLDAIKGWFGVGLHRLR